MRNGKNTNSLKDMPWRPHAVQLSEHIAFRDTLCTRYVLMNSVDVVVVVIVIRGLEAIVVREKEN